MLFLFVKRANLFISYFQENLLQILSENGKFSQFKSLLEVTEFQRQLNPKFMHFKTFDLL